MAVHSTGFKTVSTCSTCSNSSNSSEASATQLPSKASPAEIIFSPSLAAVKVPTGNIHYDELSSENKARVAIAHAFAQSPAQLLVKYSIRRVIGFGSNGVVLAAVLNETTPVAIKIIYKKNPSYIKPSTEIPSEIEILKHLNANSDITGAILEYIEDWQDKSHFYLVTELFGSDWLSSTKSSTLEEFVPILFNANYNGRSTRVDLPFSAGSSDLWAWAYAHRAYVYESSHHEHTMLPILPIKQIVKQLATTLSGMHALGFYHGDIKLENVLVQSGGQMGPVIRLADFGHSKHTSFGIKSYGTQEISPPEFLRGSPYSFECLDGRVSDIFALGMLMYMLLNESGLLPSMTNSTSTGAVGYEDLLKDDFGFYPFDSLDDFDIGGQSLLDGMCMVDPEQRVSIQQVLAHPWLADIIIYKSFASSTRSQISTNIDVIKYLTSGDSNQTPSMHKYYEDFWQTSHHTHTMLPVLPIKQIISQLAVTLAAIHSRGYYPGDIKMENILVQSRTSKRHLEVRLTDFGHAKHATYCIRNYGTQDISPPEFLPSSQYASESIDRRPSDVFALGMLLHVLLSEHGMLPTATKVAVGYNLLMGDTGFYSFDSLEDVDTDCQDLLDGMCMVDPERRLRMDQMLNHVWLAETVHF
ncbi:hypothetical protein HK100_008335 [Physocladia obscura]|uniref:Protein kinase domain-containing protein n=1 Tax=Physocladia obscura TaxID=109957 RepID=A0AAD5T576_9FUNG|nr:hypothetical protein HK100_008335 [Physocladia obscura]